MKLRIKEDLDNIRPEYGVLIYDTKTGKNVIALFYDDKEEAYEFVTDVETLGKDVFNYHDPDIMRKDRGNGFEPDSRGRCYYSATTADGEDYLQEVRVVNQEPIKF